MSTVGDSPQAADVPRVAEDAHFLHSAQQKQTFKFQTMETA